MIQFELKHYMKRLNDYMKAFENDYTFDVKEDDKYVSVYIVTMNPREENNRPFYLRFNKNSDENTLKIAWKQTSHYILYQY